ncbi:aminotransferase class III-fold pyridoxal phosphate-dependent enzyme [Streptomyces sp. NBC_00847]|uniref:aminotransferase class III-fold pyridoxal phosphate-dependent enzyme n=1 Tax=unclassified Streptomyces TaxID=2593676 RepID=UPI0022562F19|nr:aminotransferase class III-fold pyridoxal phosphate-dependent enzyme [Streptomyces sp. NBC_00847]MCX4878165.1 aminotransferase class III-fold pyridoxal phosphate-dependent enzyme [Streptomyces sp. NBC_00847]
MSTRTLVSGHADALDRARRFTASEKWDLDRRFPLVLDRASGAEVWDVAGNRYVDFTSCSGAAPLGAGHRPVLERVVTELSRSGGILPGPLSALRVELAERLAALFPVAERSFFFRTGSCATTAAVRLARVHSGARTVLTSGYHGWHDWHLQDRAPMGPPDRDPHSLDFRYDLDLLDALATVHGPVAAVIVTPEVNFFPQEYARALQDTVRRHGALLIVDEVMTGLRYATGGYHTAAGLTPDLITLSKGLANGTALSAVAGRAAVMDAVEDTYLGNTYQREVTPFAAALATLDALTDGTALARMREVGAQLIHGLNSVFAHHSTAAWAFAHPTMFDVVFADAELGQAFFQQMWSRGFLMQYGGRFMPSAATADADVDAAVTAADAALAAALAETGTGDTQADRDGELLAAATEFARERFVATPGTVETWFRRAGRA